jgi:hypothetical protein
MLVMIKSGIQKCMIVTTWDIYDHKKGSYNDGEKAEGSRDRAR